MHDRKDVPANPSFIKNSTYPHSYIKPTSNVAFPLCMIGMKYQYTILSKTTLAHTLPSNKTILASVFLKVLLQKQNITEQLAWQWPNLDSFSQFICY